MGIGAVCWIFCAPGSGWAASGTTATQWQPPAHLSSAGGDAVTPIPLTDLPTTGPLQAADLGDGVWLRPDLNVTSITLALDNLSSWGVRNVYVDVFRSGETLHASSVFPQRPAARDFDWLTLIIDEAHRRGIRVHGWMQSLCWHEGAPLRVTSDTLISRHPEWADRARDGEPFTGKSLSVYVNPAVPEVSERLATLTLELCRYPLDGINLDAIQYNERADMGYHPAAVQAFRLEEDVAPAFIEPDMAKGSDWMRWTMYREDKLTSLVERLSELVRSESDRQDRRIVLSALVQPGYEQTRGVNTRYQNWGAWVRAGLLDATTPGCFNGSLPGLEKQLWEIRSIHMGADAACIPGFMLDNIGPRATVSGADTPLATDAHPSLADQKRLLRSAGFQFCTLMDYSALAAEKSRSEGSAPTRRTNGLWGLFSTKNW